MKTPFSKVTHRKPPPTPSELLAAVRWGEVDRVKQFLEQGADPNTVDEVSGKPLLILAAGLNMSGIHRQLILSDLLRHGADPRKTDRHGNTALHEAIRCRDRTSAQLLLDHGVDIDARNIYGATCLHVAARAAMASGNVQTVSFLLDRGANSLIRDKRSMTPLQMTVNEMLHHVQSGNVIALLKRHEEGKSPECALRENAIALDDVHRAAADKTHANLKQNVQKRRRGTFRL